jgi:hypothetical protein
MADRSNKLQDLDLSGVIRGGQGSPEAPSDESSHSEKSREKFEPKAYFFGAWHLLKRDLFVFLWKFGADFVRSVLTFATFAVIAIVVMTAFTASISVPQGPLFGFERFVEKLATPGFTIGVAGVLFCAWLIGLMIDVLVLSGVWGTLATGARGEPITRFRTFFANLTTHFPEVLSLRITTLAAQATVVLLGVTVFVSILVATTGNSAFADASIWARGLLWATPLTVLAGLVALVRLTMEVAAAPLLLEGRSLGDSILVAARLVTKRFADVYRLLIVAASLLLIPLFFYWGVLIFGNLTMDVAGMAPVNTLLQFAGEVILFVTSGVIGLLFYGAVFLYYAHQMGMIDEIPGRDSDDEPPNNSKGSSKRPSGRPVVPGGGRPKGVGFGKDTTLEELLPEEYPNIVELDDVLGAEPEPEPEPEPKSDDGLSGNDVFDSNDDLDPNDRD